MPAPAPASLPLTEDRWAAIVENTAGDFVYAVRTTGIYCRPACPSRTPRRENVTLFATPEEAAAAGFRACRRCHPDAPHDAPHARVAARVAQARALLDAHLDADAEHALPLATLAEAVGWSPGHLQRMFVRQVGLSPKAYADARRVERAKAALREGDSVLAATFEGGFGSGKALYERADDALGMTPGTYRRGGAGLRIRYALYDTALGAVLVAATARGVCAVTLGDEAEALIGTLHDDFHAAEVLRDDATVGPWAEPVLRLLAGAPGAALPEAAQALLALPLHVRGTAFQRQVWAALRQIPVGETRTYGEVAAAIGRPTASRAVAQACGANPVALIVPCHRVVGAGGALRGYRWGPDRKRRLLDMEAR